MKIITLLNGKLVKVDDGDYDYLNQFVWREGTNSYAMRSVGQANLYMHRELTNAPCNLQVDHIDGDRLNNQRLNLRLITQSQNGQARKLQSNNTIGYRGVIAQSKSTNWRALIQVNGKKIHLGTYKTPELAAVAYNKAAVQYFGAGARLNQV